MAGIESRHALSTSGTPSPPHRSSQPNPRAAQGGCLRPFPAMNPAAATKLVFQAASDNYNLTFKPFVFHLPSS